MTYNPNGEDTHESYRRDQLIWEIRAKSRCPLNPPSVRRDATRSCTNRRRASPEPGFADLRGSARAEARGSRPARNRAR